LVLFFIIDYKQWGIEAKCRPGRVPPFPPLKFAYKNLK